MKWSLATPLALLAIATASGVALAQPAAPQCAAFAGLKSDAEQKAMAIRTAMEHKAERKEICTLVQRFASAEEGVVKFLEQVKTVCGVPEQAITGAKANHERTLKFRTAACADAPAVKPHVPTLSDSIGTPSVDTGNNTKTGRGTLDSLNGNPLAK
jgi:hypothetical protein